MDRVPIFCYSPVEYIHDDNGAAKEANPWITSSVSRAAFELGRAHYIIELYGHFVRIN